MVFLCASLQFEWYHLPAGPTGPVPPPFPPENPPLPAEGTDGSEEESEYESEGDEEEKERYVLKKTTISLFAFPRPFSTSV